MIYIQKEKENLSEKIDEYFRLCDAENENPSGKKAIEKPYTKSGLLLFLKENYGELPNNKATKKILEKANLKIENYIEEKSLSGEIGSSIAMFSLKKNFGWSDKNEENTTDNKIEIKITVDK